MSFVNRVIFEHTYPGNWVKKIVARNTGEKLCDPYLFAPDGAKLRSSNDLLDYLYRHPEYWPDFNVEEIHLERWTDTVKRKDFGAGTKKIKRFLEGIRSGVSPEAALQQLQHVLKDPNAPKTPRSPKPKASSSNTSTNFRRKNYARKSVTTVTTLPNMGPKSVMMKKKALLTEKKKKKHGLSREAVIKLEQHFVSNICKPNYQQMQQWASEMGVSVEAVTMWFSKKWKGKLEYEALKLREKETFDDPVRSRQVRKFEPLLDVSLVTDEDDGDECFIEYENAEEDV